MKYVLYFVMAFLMIACQNSQEYYEGIYIVGTEDLDPTAKLTVDELPSAIGVNVASSCPLESDLEVSLEVRKDLVAYYNETYQKNYELLPDGSYKIENASLTIESGKHVSSNSLRLEIISREKFKEGITYVLPISIAKLSDSKMAIIEGSKTVYVIVNQIIITQAANLDAYGRYYKANFKTPSKYDTKNLKSITFEARVRFKQMGKKDKWCFSIMGLEENLCVRAGGSITEGYKVSFAGKGTDPNSKDQIPADKWVHIACVYDGSVQKKLIYIDGKLSGEADDTRGTCDLTEAYLHDSNNSFYIGQSAADDRYMEGYVSEVRVWGIARTAAELQNNVCWVDPTTPGLIAYWRFNEVNDENKVTDLTGNGYDATYVGGWNGTPEFVPGVRCPDN